MFDAFLSDRASRTGRPFVPFDPDADYRTFVDGKPRADGTRAFLRSRGVELPAGGPDDPPEADTVTGLGNRKNVVVLRRIERDGVQTFPGSVDYVRAIRAGGLRTAVVSSSANTRSVLIAAGIEGLFDVRIDAGVAAARALAGKPASDTFLAGAADLGVAADQAAVFEDALAGVQAGRAGGFGFVVGVDRTGQAASLRAAGADVVVSDLSELVATR